MTNDNTRNVSHRHNLTTYQGLRDYVGPNRYSRKIPGCGINVPTSVFVDSDNYGPYASIKLCYTEVLRHYANGVQVIKTGGYAGTTTKQRIHIGLSHGWRLHTEKYQLYATHESGSKYAIHSSLVLLPNGIAGSRLDIAHKIVGIESADELDSIDQTPDYPERMIHLINVDYELDSVWESIPKHINRDDYGALFTWSEPGEYLAIWAAQSMYAVLASESIDLLYFA